jgi:hypothetical protein
LRGLKRRRISFFKVEVREKNSNSLSLSRARAFPPVSFTLLRLQSISPGPLRPPASSPSIQRLIATPTGAQKQTSFALCILLICFDRGKPHLEMARTPSVTALRRWLVFVALLRLLSGAFGVESAGRGSAPTG